MRSNADTRFVPLIVFPAILPSILMPLLRRLGAPDFAIGAVMGVSIGISIVAFAWMLKRRRASDRGCATRR